MNKIDVTRPIRTITDKLPCRIICTDFDYTIEGVKFPLVVAIKNEKSKNDQTSQVLQSGLGWTWHNAVS
jgi:hypothetical protein